MDGSLDGSVFPEQTEPPGAFLQCEDEGGDGEGDEHGVGKLESGTLPASEGLLHKSVHWIGHWNLALAIDDAVARDNLMLYGHGQRCVEVAQLVMEESAAYGSMALGHGGAQGGDGVGDGDHDALWRQGHKHGVRHEDGVGMNVCGGAVLQLYYSGHLPISTTGRERTKQGEEDDAYYPPEYSAQATALGISGEKFVVVVKHGYVHRAVKFSCDYTAKIGHRTTCIKARKEKTFPPQIKATTGGVGRRELGVK